MAAQHSSDVTRLDVPEGNRVVTLIASRGQDQATRRECNLHDFDKAGFSIVGTLKHDTRRYSFANRIKVVDLGIRMEDIDGLETEEVHHRGGYCEVTDNLRTNGATDEEIEFLLRQRVELNAFASDELIKWIESKLEEQGIKKVIPAADDLTGAYQRIWKQGVVHRRIEEFLKDMGDEGGDIPDDLADQVANLLKDEPELSWDQAVRQIVETAIEDDEESGEGET